MMVVRANDPLSLAIVYMIPFSWRMLYLYCFFLKDEEDIRSPIPRFIPVLVRNKGGYVTSMAASRLNSYESEYIMHTSRIAKGVAYRNSPSG